MTVTTRRAFELVLVLGVPGLLAAAHAASATQEPARAAKLVPFAPATAVARAEALQKAGRWAEGEQLLESSLSRCGSDREGRTCRLLVTRALGYFSQLQSQIDPGHGRDLLVRSTDWYARALRDDPADGATLSNLALALRALGAESDLLKLLPDAIERDPSGAGFYARLLGDVHRSRGAWLDALGAYRQAVAAAPDNEAARRRLVEVYRRLPPDSARSLFALVSTGADWESRFPDAAAEAYEVVVNALAARDRRVATDACVRWVKVLADSRLLTPARLNVLAESWLTGALRELERFLADSSHPAPMSSIWNSGEGREALGRAALAAGRQRRSTGDRTGAEALWQAGLRATQYDATVSLDLALETVTLYEETPALDANKAKFGVIEDRLISGKARVLQEAKDSAAIQRFHTVLGMIYTRKRNWGSSGQPFSAVYQLEHALATAAARDNSGGFFQPLPQLRAFLADAYTATGLSSASGAYLDAAQAFLDADAVDDALRMLDRSRAAPGTASTATADALASLIRARVTVDSGKAARAPREICEADAERGVGPSRAAGLRESFVKRQRFKLLADCVLAGPAPVRPQDAARVLTDAVDDGVQLVGAGDLVRLQRSQAAVLRIVRVPVEPGRRDPAPTVHNPNVRLLLPSSVTPMVVPLSSDLLLGARIASVVGGDTAVRGIRVRAGEVTAVTDGLSDAARANLQAKIRAVGGVRSTELPAAGAPPPAATPAPQLDDPKAELAAIVAAYARALETRNVAAVQRVVPEVDAGRLADLFRRADGLKAELQLVDYAVDGDRARAAITGTLEYRDRETRMVRQVKLDQRAMFVRGPRGWEVRAIR